jgi:SAM-dependent methyltransferase
VQSRVTLARYLLRLGGFIQSLAIMVMKPDDLVDFSRQTYSRSDVMTVFSKGGLIDAGLSSMEKALLANLPKTSGRLLIVGLGGGREAIAMAKQGFEVTAIDFIPDMAKRAMENARKRNVNISVLLQETSQLDVPDSSFDVVWLASGMYSSVPTRKRRTDLLKKISNALIPGGFLICQLNWMQRRRHAPSVQRLRRLVAFVTRGNVTYEEGDVLWGNAEFVHCFASEDECRSEFAGSGLEIVLVEFSKDTGWGGAILKRGNPA